MDRREAMPMSGSAPFYMQRGMSELHGQQQQQQQQQEDGRSFSHSGMPFQQNVVGGNSGHGFVRDPHQNVMSDGLGVGVAAAAVVQPSPTPMRRKRGRPRKYGPDGKVSLALSSMSVAPRIVNATAEKRGRGRPPGSGRKQQLAPFGRLVSSSAGVGFTPHVITVETGEDISAKLLAFAQLGPRAVCILSANGAVSTVTLRQPSTSGGTITYEGRFDILCMSGSFLLMGTDTSCDRSGGLNISLAGPDGRLIGGCVGGMLIAASPVQVVVGSFIWTSSKINHKMQVGAEGGGDSQHYSVDSSAQNHHFNPTTSMGGWATPQTLDMRNSHVDIDLMRG